RKMSELGFQRSSKKCREKFENVYKYHKRTKDGRASKPDGKAYRFFDQLEALENNPFNPQPPQGHRPPPANSSSNNNNNNNNSNPSSLHIPPPQPSYGASLPTSPTPLSVLPPPPQMGGTPHPPGNAFQQSHFHVSTSFLSGSISTSSTSSDDDIRRRGRKRKWKDYLQRLIRDVIQKQEELQKKFLETLEKRERDRIAREEAWRVQEIARMNREQDLLVKERSMSAAKDAAVIAFLQKITDQHNLQLPPLPVFSHPMPTPIIPPLPEALHVAVPEPAPPPASVPEPNNNKNNGDNFSPASSSRWPKAEVQALINLRTSLDIKYQETGPKGPLWEEISAAMGKLGYSRSSKRCKEKWENINKYYKKVKESNKIRPEDSKTCPYFHQLEAIYKERAKNEIPPFAAAAPIMARPEQQWPQHQQPGMQNQVLDNVGLNNDEEDEDDDDEDDDDE
ncbi:hypothetical protein M569_17578, partial [Genlisea aurea]